MKKFTNSWTELKEAIRQHALTIGFDAAGFAPPHPPPYGEKFQNWLEQGCHGDMSWMARNPKRRIDPKHLLPDVGSILVLGRNYRPPILTDKIAAYACHVDYHALLKNRVQELGQWLEKTVGHPVTHKACVDTAPILEKPLAVAAGLGWQGKNALLVSRRFGCWMLLAELFIALPLPPDSPDQDHCATCDRCLRACPTDALTTPYQMDASRCLAYLTVEAQGTIPRHYRQAMGTRIFGCDACITSCPWNRFAPITPETQFLPWIELTAVELPELAQLNQESFNSLFCHTPMQRLGVNRLLRNVATALGNWREAAALPPLELLLNHESPLVREHAAWGLGQIIAHGGTQGEKPAQQQIAQALTALRNRERQEREPTVLQEIQMAYTWTFTFAPALLSKCEGSPME